MVPWAQLGDIAAHKIAIMMRFALHLNHKEQRSNFKGQHLNHKEQLLQTTRSKGAGSS